MARVSRTPLHRPAADHPGDEHPRRVGHGRGRPASEPSPATRCSRTRDKRLREAKRVARIQFAAAVLLIAGAIAVGWRAMGTEGATAPAAGPGVPPVVAESESLPDPTQVFATYKTVDLYLPFAVGTVKAIGFHQASFDNALHMTSVLPDADSEAARAAHHIDPPTLTQVEGSAPQLTGTVLRMWRDRPGNPDSAVDVAADPGTTVLSPVTGTVLQVKPYKLYNKHDDFEIHIRPDAMVDVDVVIIHVDAVSADAGDRVIGGVTPIAVVRKLSDRVTMQIGDFIGDGGDHVHIQVNRIETEGELANPGGS